MYDKITFSFIFLPVILFIGIITSYDDFKSSRIKNEWIIAGLVYSFTVYFFSWILLNLFPGNIVNSIIGKEVFSSILWNFDKWSINLIISILVAYLLWHYKVWGAGDAKLFIAYAALIPMGQYSKVYLGYNFASFLLLLNAFIPATIFIFVKTLFYFFKLNNIKGLKEKILKFMQVKLATPKIIDTLKILLGFSCLFLFFAILNQEFRSMVGKVFPKQTILMMIFLLLYGKLSKFFLTKSKFMALAFLMATIYIIFKLQNSGFHYFLIIANSLNKSIWIMLLFPLLEKLIGIYTDNTLNKYVHFAIWMFIGALITWFV